MGIAELGIAGTNYADLLSRFQVLSGHSFLVRKRTNITDYVVTFTENDRGERFFELNVGDSAIGIQQSIERMRNFVQAVSSPVQPCATDVICSEHSHATCLPFRNVLPIFRTFSCKS